MPSKANNAHFAAASLIRDLRRTQLKGMLDSAVPFVEQIANVDTREHSRLLREKPTLIRLNFLRRERY